MTEVRVRPNTRRQVRRRLQIPAWLAALAALILITAAVAVASTSIALVVGLLLLGLGACYELRAIARARSSRK